MQITNYQVKRSNNMVRWMYSNDKDARTIQCYASQHPSAFQNPIERPLSIQISWKELISQPTVNCKKSEILVYISSKSIELDHHGVDPFCTVCRSFQRPVNCGSCFLGCGFGGCKRAWNGRILRANAAGSSSQPLTEWRPSRSSANRSACRWNNIMAKRWAIVLTPGRRSLTTGPTSWAMSANSESRSSHLQVNITSILNTTILEFRLQSSMRLIWNGEKQLLEGVCNTCGGAGTHKMRFNKHP